MLWFQPGANSKWLRTREGVARMMDKCRRAGIGIVVFEIEQRGYVSFNSDIGPHFCRVKEWGFPPGYDLIKVGSEEAARRGLKFYVTRAYGNPRRYPYWQNYHYRLFEVAIAADGWAELVTRSNEPIGNRELGRYTDARGNATGTKAGVTEVVVKGDAVAAISTAGNTSIPEDGYVLAGTGWAADFLSKHFPVGSRVKVDSRPLIVRIDFAGGEVRMMNCFLPENKEYTFDLLREVLTRYHVDGVVLDVVRYTGYSSEFSDVSRRSFERFLGRPVSNWPQEILTWRRTDGGQAMVPGPLFGQWSMWRAMNVRQYIQDNVRMVKAIDPRIPVGDYVGAWYPVYNDVGVNWASDRYYPGYSWAPVGYNMTGYAGDLDFLCVGLYYPSVTIAEAIALGQPPWKSVEGGADLSNRVVMEATPVVGTLFVLDYRGRPEAFRAAIRMARQKTGTVAIFDASYVENYDWWGVLGEALREDVRLSEAHSPGR